MVGNQTTDAPDDLQAWPPTARRSIRNQWGALRAAVDSFEKPVQIEAIWDRGKIVANAQEVRKVG